MLAIGDYDLRLYQVKNHAYLTTLEVNGTAIKDIAFRPHADEISAITNEGSILQTWEIPEGKMVREYSDCSYSHIAYSPDGDQLAAAGSCGIRIWQAGTGSIRQGIPTPDPITTGLSYASEGQLVGVSKVSLASWNVTTGALRYSTHFSDQFSSVLVSIQPGLMVMANIDDKAFVFFDTTTGQRLYDFATNNGRFTVALSPNQRVLAHSDENNIILTDAVSGVTLASVDFDWPDIISISPDGRFLAANSYENTVHLWDISKVADLAQSLPRQTATPAIISTATPTPSVAPTVSPTSVAPLSVQTQPVPTAQPGAITSQNIGQLQQVGELGFGEATSVAWSPDGEMLAVSAGTKISLFDSSASQPSKTLISEGVVVSMAFNQDGSLLAGQGSNYMMSVWDVVTGKQKYKLNEEYCWARKIFFAPDGQTLTVDCGGMSYRWDMRDGSLISQGADPHQNDFSPDGTKIVTAYGFTARLLDQAGHILRSFEYPDMAPGMASFSPDGKTLLIWFYQYDFGRSGAIFPGKDRKTVIQLWNIASGEEPSLRIALSTGQWEMELPEINTSQGATFTADSRRLVTASGDGQVQIWDVTSGSLLYTLPGGKVFQLSVDGHKLVTFDPHGIAHIWDVTPGRDPVAIWTIKGFTGTADFVQFTRDGKELISATNQVFQVFDWANGKPTGKSTLFEIPNGPANVEAASSNGKYLAYNKAGKIVLGERNRSGITWRTLYSYTGELPDIYILALAFSPDGTRLAASTPDETVHILDLNHSELTEF